MIENISSFVLLIGTGTFFFGFLLVIAAGAPKNSRGSFFDSPIYTINAFVNAINRKQWKPFAILFFGILLILLGSLKFSNLFK